MKYEKNVLLVLLLLISSMKLAGSVSPGFGEVDDSLVIQMKDEIFPSAKAVYMFKRSSVRVEGEYIIIDVFNRIKIYNDDFEYLGNIEIPVRSYGRKEVKVYDIQAVSFNEENGIIKRSELAQGDIYKQELGENVQAYKFAVPQVRSRSVVDVRYSYRAPLGYAIPTFYFQEDAPVKNARLEIEAPEYIEFQMVASGLAYFDELEPEVRSSSLEVQYRETSNVVSTTSSYSASATSGSVSVLEKVKQPNSVLQENGRNSALSLSKEGYSDQIRHVRRIFEGKNIPSYSVDDYVLNRDDFRTGVRFELKSISYPGRKVLSFSKDWNTLARELRSEKLIAKNLTKPVRKSLPKLNLDSAENLEAKVKAVYDLIRTNYEWDGKFGISRNDTKFSTIINEKRGNVADVNGLLINQLNRYGVNAKPVYIKSRNRGLLNTAIPNYYDLDYMLAYVQIWFANR